ncbi:MAG: aminotransferase [Candidatus Yonathbacteria bacterium RBG_16_43_6]|uniref:alanine transaminase n=2 Tax=Parcubacteria group TaxID=1794811 RepID=A0A1G2SED2_9BACT|nr:MAG: Aminotransferase class I and II [Candidatus Azambacteria bacterium GW2011_GWA1_44_9]OHA79204.1 MAG: aminotransferase [Candidatus Yonathbacteria bacterium RBG_16_43_6]OHA79230.1 MAG: aminotransferase [Candidatus Yonathbacteria bacterium RIFCSPHIGHO2_01_FULL_44_19]OHA83168.1 MAG: aminotransferase [Candidatus Yonathbacteria bacterium RIFCSPLOWO2_01_FULL_43_27]
MRTNIVHPGADKLTYEIREIVEVGQKLQSLGVPIIWENIGDPVAKGENTAPWVKEIIAETIASDDKSFAYSPTKGLLETREFLAKRRNALGGVQITAEDILFFNGLGDAISKVYTYLNPSARVIGPNPAYSTHSSSEGAHSGSAHITYRLNPHRNWLPDLEELRNKVKYNPTIAGILIINPDNPTGMVYPERVLREIVAIAREHDLFIISDEIYGNIVYGDEKFVPLSQVCGDVPCIAMKGLSKEIPWPGARSGWIEFYNKERDPSFARYAKTLVDAKMLEVCSTTLPQKVLPKIFSDARYTTYLAERTEIYKQRANIAYEIFSGVRGVTAPKPTGAFYMSVVFDDGVLNNAQKLRIDNPKAKHLVESMLTDVAPDKRFVYYLMASTGVCVVPLSGFNSDLYGFRVTLLEPDIEKFKKTFDTIASAIKTYFKS